VNFKFATIVGPISLPSPTDDKNNPMNRFLRICRTVHSWLGALVMPWVLIIGFTGFYLNHSQLVLRAIGYHELAESDLAGASEAEVTQELAQQIATAVWPDELVLESGFIKYRGGRALALKKDSGLIIIPGPQTNHYFVSTTFSERTYTLDGKLVHQQYNLKPILKSLHERGWVGKSLGTWLADIVAGAMVFFSLSGLIMWSVPRIRKVRVLLRGRPTTTTVHGSAR
jgi:hypothetical protein